MPWLSSSSTELATRSLLPSYLIREGPPALVATSTVARQERKHVVQSVVREAINARRDMHEAV